MRTFSLLAVVLTLLLAPSPASAQISDSALGERVAESIRTYSHFSIFDDVNIEVNNRVVTLTGRVTTQKKHDEIGVRVAKIDGVRSLTNSIGVLPLSQADDRLRYIIAQAIYGHPTFWPYAQMPYPPIHIIIEGGHVTLTGAVSSEVERQLANSLANVPGVFDVTNKLRKDR